MKTLKSVLCGLLFLFVGGYITANAEDSAKTQQYREDCERGMPISCNNLGVAYEQGDGVSKDAAKAAALYG
ncbi:MAG: hypothetical protein V7701_17715, partial [Sneathiella sp.]